MAKLTDHYKEKYGDWAGNPKGNAPRFDRCCAELMDKYHPGGYQCTRKNGHGPDGAYCKQHDPEAVAKRDAKRLDAERVRYQKMRLEWAGPRFYAALCQIADGHNDPRSLAQEIISPYRGKEDAGRAALQEASNGK